MKLILRWLLIVPLSLVWPLVHTLVFLLRFGGLMPGGLSEALVFVPMSLAAGLVLLVLVARAPTRARRSGAIWGYILASPIAFMGSLFGGLMFTPLVGTLIFGAVPLVIGMLIGYFAAPSRPRS